MHKFFLLSALFVVRSMLSIPTASNLKFWFFFGKFASGFRYQQRGAYSSVR